MKQKIYLQTISVIFTVIAIVHVLRLLNGWQVKISTFVVPLWVSWIGAPVALFLAYQAAKFLNKK